jgi:hypothetical protein
LRNWGKKNSQALCSAMKNFKTSFWILPSGLRCKVVSLNTSTANCNLNSRWYPEFQKLCLTYCKWACVILPVFYSSMDV